MQGLELSRLFWQEYGSSLVADLPESVRWHIAFGLVGEGSECLGFDDELSHDHDFGPGFCLWLPDEFAAQWQSQLQKRYDALPHEYMGYTRRGTELAGKRVGVFSFGEFFGKFCGSAHAPQTEREWLFAPEQGLLCVSAGEVFHDPSGEFSAQRRSVQFFYPANVLRKKLAANLASCAQAGQYNLPRCCTRQDWVAAELARAEFLQSLMAVFHLLSHCYMPFYKWSYRSLSERCGLDPKLVALIGTLAEAPIAKLSQDRVEMLCCVVADTLRGLGYVHTKDNFLLVAAQELQASITSELRDFPLSVGVYRLWSQRFGSLHKRKAAAAPRLRAVRRHLLPGKTSRAILPNRRFLRWWLTRACVRRSLRA